MTRRAAAILLASLVVAVGAIALWTRPQALAPARRRIRAFLRVTPSPVAVTPPPAGTPAVTAPETVRVTVFFLGAEDGLLHAEQRDIAKPAGPGSYLKALYAELAKGPTRTGLSPVLPAKIQLRNAFLLSDGVAVLDLAVDSGLAFGADEELSIVAALVDTVLQNVADTTRVRILVNGEPAETLGGHVDLTQPLLYLHNAVAP
jgi:sporulation and spore germination protein